MHAPNQARHAPRPMPHAERRRRVLRALSLGAGLVLCAAYIAAPARAQDLLHYEPPPVDSIYPPGDDSEPVDAGVLPADLRGLDAGALDAGLPPVLLPVAPPPPEQAYGARATVVRNEPEGAHVVPLQSARDLPGAFGDPLRILDALPGVVPIASGVPYVYVRGAPPASFGYSYDDIPLPQLYHAAFGPAVVHPRATGPVEFHGGVPPARFGRRAGGLLRAEGTPYTRDFAAELEVRLIDVGGWVQGPLGKGVASASGRIGYPKLAIVASEALGVVEPGTKLNYWDGQVRTRQPVSARGDVELVWLGAYDAIKLPGVSNVPGAGASKLHFHRIETRYVQRLPRGEFGTALRFGFDQSELGSALAVRAFTLGPRFWTELRFGRQRVRFGGDIFVSQGHVRNGEGSLGSPDGDLRVSLPQIADAPARAQGGTYIESTLQATARARFDLGLRFDYWSRQADLDFAADPRVRASYDLTPALTVHAAFGLGHQPSVFFFPLPGLTEVAVDRGLSRSIQSEVGARYQLPHDLRLELTAYVHQYTRLLLPELISDGSIENDPPLSDALAYGMELFLKRNLGRHLTGWLSYTLGWAEADSQRSIGKFRPDFDVRHVLNAVMQWQVWRGLTLGGRLHARSGRLIEQLNPRYEQRLPWFVRGDMRVGYGWRGRFAQMVAYVEWLNIGVQGEYLDADCLFGRCIATRAPPISIPNLGVRAEF
ncbi:MAG: TonB-dependent receptor [Polyangiales bacterium]